MTEPTAAAPALSTVRGAVAPVRWRRALHWSGRPLTGPAALVPCVVAAAAVASLGASRPVVPLDVRLTATLVVAAGLVHGVSALISRGMAGCPVPATSAWTTVAVAALPAVGARVGGVAPGWAFVGPLGLTLPGSLAPRRKAVTVAARAATAALVGVVAWLGYSTLVAHSAAAFVPWSRIARDRQPQVFRLADLVTLLGAETLAVLAVVATTSVLVWLLPTRDGAALWALHPALWGVCYLAAALLGLAVLVPPDSGAGTAAALGVCLAVAAWIPPVLTGSRVAPARRPGTIGV